MIHSISFFAGLAAGFINAIAGGGTLVSFPILVSLGLAPVLANMTNTIALCPGYFGGVYTQRKEFKNQKKRLYAVLPICITGGVVGGLLLLHSDERAFKTLIPWLILLASLLLAVQVPVKTWLQTNGHHRSTRRGTIGAFFLLFFASVYGGYFGPGLSVIVMAILGLIYDDSLTSLNLLKQAIAFSINISAALYFVLSSNVPWLIILVMSIGSIAGGMIGGSLIGRINQDTLRWTIVVIGILIAGMYVISG